MTLDIDKMTLAISNENRKNRHDRDDEMSRRFVLTGLSIASLLLFQAIVHTRVDWRRLPAAFSEPLVSEHEARTNMTSFDTHLHQYWWNHHSANASRVWNSTLDYSWCIPQHSKKLAHHFIKKARDVRKLSQVDGLIFVKSPKAASSTGAGISLRISDHVGNRFYGGIPCTVNYTHPFAYFRGHAKRSSTSSLLWTIVREPAARQLSIYNFFFLARKGLNSSNEQNVFDFLATHKSGQFRYLATRHFAPSVLERKSTLEQQILVKSLLEHYHFMAVAERMPESLVVMKLLFGLEHDDLIVLPSKVGYDYKTCRRVVAIQVTSTIQEFIHTNFTVDNIDYLLYAAANRSLDETIESLGREKFNRELKEHRRLQALAEKECIPDILPCSQNKSYLGDAQVVCYAGDSGCGYPCVDRVLKQDARAMRAVEETAF